MLQQIEAIGQEFHEATKHSYLSVMMDPNYIDASTQPSVFKRYPHFYQRFPLDPDNPIHCFIRLTSSITWKKFAGNNSYFLRVNPSAGALYPTEIYVQIRGVKGFVDGLYHLEVQNNCLTLIYELVDDGIDNYVLHQQLVKGFIFLVSCAYFRSSWKYKNRSLRYCFLDSGHHLGTIEASAYLYQQNIKAIFEFDKRGLNQVLGLENQEFITAAVVSGHLKDKPVKRLRSQLPFVAATDYFEANPFVEEGYKSTVVPTHLTNISQVKVPGFKFDHDHFYQTVLQRRSARFFGKQVITKFEFSQILAYLDYPLNTDSLERIEIYSIINRVEGMQKGVYQGEKLIKTDDFSEKAGYLCINQALARDSAVTFFFVCDYRNYQTAMQWVGWLGHRLYLISNYLNIGCSGIGAYYDDETQEFLETPKPVLYGMAIGR
ncbi:conserved hypothetical protein [Gloeothece citriformis PCC 7424]|uniref:Nitroreductase domain-containing protein n=1 Tax=Gloeothece citriformis (strain PCC 7424) TaxID=65393 RepID=B7KG56_GLOC7|nr:SagB family peptide dehydrogenase [Gloeothece citriformis]ACK70527.1 conserved hypothetical protein [Gloeothece citriformis PCC 7424]